MNRLSGTGTGNPLLDRLVRLVPNVTQSWKRIHAQPGAPLYRPGEPMPYLYFPAGGVLSVVTDGVGRRSAVVATVGSEGLVPVSALLRVRSSAMLVVTQVPGDIVCVPAAPVLQAMLRDERVLALLHCYVAYFLRFALQGTACNTLHSVLARAARWLLMIGDRAASDQFFLTQELLGGLLGTPRQTVNVAMRKLAKQKLVSVSRGRVRLLDRRALERIACECYALMNDHYRELLG